MTAAENENPPVATYVTRPRHPSIDDYARQVANIWPDDNRRPILSQWLGVVDHATALVEEVRKSSWHRVAHETAEVFVWWLSFITRLSQKPSSPDKQGGLGVDDAVYYFPDCSPSKIVWYKFPGLCPVCFGYELACGLRRGHERPFTRAELKDLAGVKTVPGSLFKRFARACGRRQCTCLARKEFVDNRPPEFKGFVKCNVHRLAGTTLAKMPKTLIGLENTLRYVFEPSIHALSITEIAFHLLEEVGEVADALKNLQCQPHPQQSQPRVSAQAQYQKEKGKRLMNLGEELADVFSWTLALQTKTYNILTSAEKYGTQYADTPEEKENVKFFARKLIRPAATLEGLVWRVFSNQNENFLTCDKCKKRRCNRDAPEHKNSSGRLFGQTVVDLFELITSVNPWPD